MTLNSSDHQLVSNVLPVGMQNSALVLKDEDGNSVITDLEELSTSSEPNLVPAAINVENSSDVIIGPVTQFNGPVTIYQNVTGQQNSLEQNGSTNHLNGRLVKSESTSSEPAHQTEKSSKKPSLIYAKHFKYVGISLIILIIIAVAVATISILSIKSDSGLPPTPDNHSDESGEQDGDDTLQPAGPGVIIKKKAWGGRAALNFTVPLPHPTSMVIISHTATPTCLDFPTCSKRVQSIQNYHVAQLGSPDIGYNFLIGGDGNAYVGRGWDIKNFHQADTIGISFIGNYIYDTLTENMKNIAKKLLKEGVESGKLSKNYKLVAHNQTFATESPGKHVYEVIKTWPHFDPKIYISN